jgi:membrane protease YdiL (CAAX protease family)
MSMVVVSRQGDCVPELNEFRTTAEAYLILAVTTGIPAACLWLLCVRPRPLLPIQRQRAVPWSGFEIWLLVFLVFFFWPAAASEFITRSRFLDWFCGPDSVAALTSSALSELRKNERRLWAPLLAAPAQIATIMLVPLWIGNTRPYQLGLSGGACPRRVVLGWVGWALLSPAVLGCHIVCIWAAENLWHATPEEHPLIQIFKSQSQAKERLAMIVGAVVAAPVLEELFFRGLLQPWFSKRRWGGAFAMWAALSVSIFLRADGIDQAWTQMGIRGVVHELAPAAFVLVMMPGAYLLPRMLPSRRARPTADLEVCRHTRIVVADLQVCQWKIRAIYGTALLFAAVHANIWPTPIPLFLLALGLGYLAYRTQNLIAPILVHSLFNAVSCVGLFLS